MNYLPDAVNHGAEIFCEASVSHVEKTDSGWRVYYQNVGKGRDKFDAPTVVCRSRYCSIGCGNPR